MKIKWLNLVKNKYIISSVVFLVWMTFLNDIDLVFVIQKRQELSELKEQVERLEDEIIIAEEALDDLNNNTESLEKFAREEYLMRRSNEDLYIIKEVSIE